jgi:hypothetical protein
MSNFSPGGRPAGRGDANAADMAAMLLSKAPGWSKKRSARDPGSGTFRSVQSQIALRDGCGLLHDAFQTPGALSRRMTSGEVEVGPCPSRLDPSHRKAV